MDNRRLYKSWSNTISETWRSTYNFNYIINSLSKSMKEAIKDSIENNYKIICSKATKKSLIQRNVCNENGFFTQEGKVVAIAISSLKKQVDALSLKLNRLEYGSRIFPKLKIKDYLSNFYDYSNPDHYKAIVSSEILRKKIFPEIIIGNILLDEEDNEIVSFDEGGSMMFLLSCICYDVIRQAWEQYNFELYNSNKTNDKHSFNENDPAYSTIGGITLLSLMKNEISFYEKLSDKLISAVKTSTEKDIDASLSKLKILQPGMENENWSYNNCIGLKEPLIKAMYKALGNDILTEIIKLYLLDPNALGKGWPDLTMLTKEESIKLIEIKTSDKLQISQIITFPEINKFIPVEVLKVVHANSGKMNI